MTIKESKNTKKTLEELRGAENKSRTASAVSYRFEDSGEGEGGFLQRKVECDGSMPWKTVLVVKAGDTVDYKGVAIEGS